MTVNAVVYIKRITKVMFIAEILSGFLFMLVLASSVQLALPNKCTTTSQPETQSEVDYLFGSNDVPFGPAAQDWSQKWDGIQAWLIRWGPFISSLL